MSERPFQPIQVLGWFTALAVIFWLIWFLLFFFFPSETQTKSDFGSFFGAIESLISGLAFAFLACTAYLQMKQLEAIRKSLEFESTPILDIEVSSAHVTPAFSKDVLCTLDKLEIQTATCADFKISARLEVLNDLPAILDAHYSSIKFDKKLVCRTISLDGLPPILARGNPTEFTSSKQFCDSDFEIFVDDVKKCPITFEIAILFRTVLGKRMILSVRYLLSALAEEDLESASIREDGSPEWPVDRAFHLPMVAFKSEIWPRTYSIKPYDGNLALDEIANFLDQAYATNN